MDNLPSVAPTSGMMAAGMAAAQKESPDGVPTMTIKPDKQQGDTSWMDSMPAVQPTTGMLISQGKAGAPQGKGLAANFAAGANKSIFGAVGAPVDLATGAINLVPRGINAATGSNIPTIQNPVGGSQWLGQQFGKGSTDPNTVQPTSEAERVAQGAGGAVAQVPTMALGGAAAAGRVGQGMMGSVANALRTSGGTTALPAALTATAAGVGGGVGQAAEDAAPEGAKPYANLAGNLAGAGGVVGSAWLANGGGRFIARKAGEMGISPWKQDLDGVLASRAQANAVGNKLATNIGVEGQQNIERATTAEQQAQSLQQTLDDPNAAPADRQIAQQKLQDIQGRRINLVPGSSPTTAQVAQTAGASALEKQAKLTHGPEFEEAQKAQNNARVGAIQNLEPTGANPASVGDLFTQHLQQLDQSGQATIGAAAGARDTAVQASGGTAPTADYGGQMREMIQGAEQPVHAAASAAFKAVDPDGSWTIQAQPLRDAASKIAMEVSPTAKTDAQTNALLTRGMSQPNVIPFSALSQMRADANDALKRLMRTGEAPSEVRRLSLFKQGIDQTIAKAVNDHAAIDPGLAGRLQSQVGQGAADSNGGVRPGVSPGGGGSAGAGQSVGGAGASPGGRGGTAGADTLAAQASTTGSPEPGLTPNFGGAEAGQYQNAVAKWRDYMQQYHQGGVGDVLKKNDQGFKVQEGNVPSKIFTGGPAEPAQVAHFIDAVGGADKAADLGRNVLANDLRTKGIIKPDGSVDANRLAMWNRSRQATLQQFPGLADHFASVETAQRTLNDVTAAHKAAIDDFNKSAAANFIHDDPLRAIGKAFSSGNPTETFRQLAAGVRGTPAAEAGLKRGVVDYISQRFRSTTPSSDGIDFLQPGGFRKWVDTNKAPLRILFGGQGMQDLQMVAADLRRAAEGPKAIAGSQTTPLLANAKKLGSSVVGHGGPAGLSMLALLGEHLGEHLTGHGLIAAGVTAGGGMLVNALRQSGIHTMEHLTAEAMLHPELARTLMERAGASKALSVVSQRRIATALQGALLADMATTGEKRQ